MITKFDKIETKIILDNQKCLGNLFPELISYRKNYETFMVQIGTSSRTYYLIHHYVNKTHVWENSFIVPISESELNIYYEKYKREEKLKRILK